MASANEFDLDILNVAVPPSRYRITSASNYESILRVRGDLHDYESCDAALAALAAVAGDEIYPLYCSGGDYGLVLVYRTLADAARDDDDGSSAIASIERVAS